MARQIFTLLMFLVAGLFLMQTCRGKEGPPAALRSFKVNEPDVGELYTLAAGAGDEEVLVRFDKRGTVTDISLGGTDARLWRQRGIPAYIYGVYPHGMGAADEYCDVEEFLHVVRTHVLSAYDYLSG